MGGGGEKEGRREVEDKKKRERKQITLNSQLSFTLILYFPSAICPVPKTGELIKTLKFRTAARVPATRHRSRKMSASHRSYLTGNC